MKHPEYDSPFEVNMSDITTRMAKNFDDACWKAVQRVEINADKEKLLSALRQDAERYREAYANGYDTGYEKRDDDIVRCKDCIHRPTDPESKGFGQYLVFPDDTCPCQIGDNYYSWMPEDDWFCANGEREDETEIIRCKDCKYFGVEDRTCNYHETYFILVKPDNYCTHGEMKEQEEEDDP